MNEVPAGNSVAAPVLEPPQGGRRSGDTPAGRRLGWWPLLAWLLLSALTGTTALVSQQLTVSRAANAIPNAGFVWPVAQYQIAHYRLKQELRAVAAGEPVNAAELKRRVAVLASTASILTEPSELRSLMDRLPGYGEATRRVADLQRQVGATLDKEAFSQADAVEVLATFRAVGDDELLSQLASGARAAEVNAKEAAADGLSGRIWWAWAGFAGSWVGLSFWLLYAIRSRRRYREAALDRQRAVTAMELAVTSKRKFLSMVNHEVRSPLQSIVTSAEVLASRDSRPESIAAIRRIRHAVTALQGQLRDLLTIARGEAAKLPTQDETFDFGELVRDVCVDFDDAAAAKGLALHVEIPASPLTIRADPIRIAQVLRNLVENAVRYTSAGEVRVVVEPFAAGLVEFSVRDTGPGLPASAAERLRSAAVPFASSNDGTGIGLFVIRDVLQQLGGQIDVRTGDSFRPQGRGTMLAVNIPAVEMRHEELKARSVEGVGLLNILVVDDLEDVRESLCAITRRLGHACHAVGSADEARPLLASEPFDAVLIDLEMPGTDGRSLAIHIRQGGGPNAASMLLLISAADNQPTGQAWPFDGFVQKPVDGLALERLLGTRVPA